MATVFMASSQAAGVLAGAAAAPSTECAARGDLALSLSEAGLQVSSNIGDHVPELARGVLGNGFGVTHLPRVTMNGICLPVNALSPSRRKTQALEYQAVDGVTEVACLAGCRCSAASRRLLRRQLAVTAPTRRHRPGTIDDLNMSDSSVEAEPLGLQVCRAIASKSGAFNMVPENARKTGTFCRSGEQENEDTLAGLFCSYDITDV